MVIASQYARIITFILLDDASSTIDAPNVQASLSYLVVVRLSSDDFRTDVERRSDHSRRQLTRLQRSAIEHVAINLLLRLGQRDREYMTNSQRLVKQFTSS